MFYLYRPFCLGEDQRENEYARRFGGDEQWVGERWWHKIAHVCQRWRNLVLGSAYYLDVCLLCTYGTPIADILAHSPPLPLAIDYHFDVLHPRSYPTTENEEGAIQALKQRDRVRRVTRVRLQMPITSLQKLIVAIDEEYPILEYLIITRTCEFVGNDTTVIFPKTFQAPKLRHLTIPSAAIPISSRLLPTAAGMVRLCLRIVHPSTYLQPNTLLQWLSFMPQLETLILSAASTLGVEEQLMHTPIMTPVTLLNLYRFTFSGADAYLEAFLRRITSPHLKKLDIDFNKSQYSVPYLLQFINATETLRFDGAKVMFTTGNVCVTFYLRGETNTYAISIAVWVHESQLSSMAQILTLLSQSFAVVEHLTLGLDTEGHFLSEAQSEVDRTEWRKLLRSFGNVKTLWIDNRLVEGLSRCLQLDDGEFCLKLLPDLQELTYYGGGNTGDGFTSFIDARQNAGRPIALVPHRAFINPSYSVR